MIATIGAIISGVIAVLGFIVWWIVKGALAGAGKKGAEHVWHNKEEYGKKIKEQREKYRG